VLPQAAPRAARVLILLSEGISSALAASDLVDSYSFFACLQGERAFFFFSFGPAAQSRSCPSPLPFGGDPGVRFLEAAMARHEGMYLFTHNFSFTQMFGLEMSSLDSNLASGA